MRRRLCTQLHPNTAINVLHFFGEQSSAAKLGPVIEAVYCRKRCAIAIGI